ncbi:hypothetical protein GCM10011362_13550 [Marinobacter halophilus]|nr:hypothetical protein GCM10011362_13550 [Marinobacter halophilus]
MITKINPTKDQKREAKEDEGANRYSYPQITFACSYRQAKRHNKQNANDKLGHRFVHSVLSLTPTFSGSLGRAKRRQGCPVEGREVRNELKRIVMFFRR